ncbi:MAG: hypothetical protein F4X47_16465 [Gammaproteobacteria bacterium]|nr:hypothetical protein [Gammaproteobacteria bacterium]MYC53901.1 hypothetical protein [Gammaproteobacteria bacterium]
MHDIKALDDRGLPGLLIATTAFREAASFQIPSLGFEPEIVWVPHPVQNRRPDELDQLAEDAVDAVLRRLISGDEG